VHSLTVFSFFHSGKQGKSITFCKPLPRGQKWAFLGVSRGARGFIPPAHKSPSERQKTAGNRIIKEGCNHYNQQNHSVAMFQ
jgi:hypothetical protein